MSKTLLIGNGINRCFKDTSWQKAIQDILVSSNSNLTYADIKDVPMNMQIVLASNDNVDIKMKDFAKKLFENEVVDRQRELINKIVDCDWDNILTTNYSYEIEETLGVKRQLRTYYDLRKWTRDNLNRKDKILHLYEYNEINNYPHIWHIHGDICTPSSIIIGHYYYGKILSAIEQYTSKLISKYFSNTPYKKESWIDGFVLDDLYILGFSLDLCEIDIWWLLCYKHRHFKDTKVYFYIPKKDLSNNVRLMLEVYGVIIKDNIELQKNNYYKYYLDVVEDIKKG